MKTIEELQELSDNIAKAVFVYHKAVEANLKESGKEYKVIGSKDDGGLLVENMDCVIDKVRYNNDTENVEAHVCKEDWREIDYWLDISYFEEDETCIYDKIEWDD